MGHRYELTEADVETDVVVVGAGPVGSTLALELARHGVASVVVDALPAPSAHPKMDFLSARSMELVGRLGDPAEIRDLGVPSDHAFTFLWCERFGDSPLSRWHYPSVDELRRRMALANDGTMPREPYQRVMGSLLEALGRERCRATALVDLREGWKLTSLAEGGDRVTAGLADRGGRTARVTGRYLVGCDGANSTVRRLAGMAVDEIGPSAYHCDVYFRSRDEALGRHGRFFLAIFSAGLTLVSRDGDQRWTATFPLPDGNAFAGDPVAEIRSRMGIDFDVDEVMTVAHWWGRLGVARSYRSGSIFLAGDAAHQFFPTGGHGANTGIGDAVDLGWKLAAVLNGWGGGALLDSYEAERRPVALFGREMCWNLLEVWRRFPALAAAGASPAQLAGFLDQERHQVDNLGIHLGARYSASPVVCREPGPEPPWDWSRIIPTTWPGSRLPSVRLGDGTELFDELGPELTLVDASGEHAGKPLWEEAERAGVPLRYLVVDDAGTGRVLERELVLVRPDQHVAWRGRATPAHARAVLDRVCGWR